MSPAVRSAFGTLPSMPGRYGIEESKDAAKHCCWRTLVLTLRLLMLLLVIVSVAPTRGQTPENGKTEPLSYRRIFVPEDAIASQNGVYLPVERERFDRLLRTVREKYLAPQVSLRPQIEQAMYTAQLDGDQLVNGTAELLVVNREASPGTVSLEPSNLAVEQVTWKPREVPDQEAAGTNAVIGIDDKGRIVAVIPCSGSLLLDWSLRGRRGAQGELSFPIQFPASPVNQLRLTLPVGLRPIVDGALVARVESDTPDESIAEWLIQLQGKTDTQLLVVPASQSESAGGLLFLRELTRYQFRERGLEAVFSLHLDVHHQSVHRLIVGLDPSLQLIAARAGERELAWTETRTSSECQVTLQFDEPLRGNDQVVELTALAEIQLNRLWSLPAVTVEAAQWLDGQAILVVSDPLEVVELQTRDARQTSGPPDDPSSETETLLVRRFGTQAETAVVLRRQPCQVFVNSGTTVNIGNSTIRARQVVDITSTGEGPFHLDVETTSEWTIDLIEAEPAEGFDEWRSVGGNATFQRTRIALRDGLASDRPIRVVLYGHRLRTRLGNRLNGRDIRLATFRDAQTTRRLMAVSADAPDRVQVIGDADLVRINPQELPESDRQRVTVGPGSIVYVDDGETEDLAIVVRGEPPRYRAEVSLLASYGPREVQHTARIRCIPQGAGLRRVQVHFTETPCPQDALRWSVLGEEDIGVHPLRPEDAFGDAEQIDGESWTLELTVATEQPIELVAEWSQEFADSSPVPLVYVPGASSQTSVVQVACRDALPIAIHAENLKAIPADPSPPREISTLRGVFRYDPLQENRLVVTRIVDDGLSPAWVWSMHVTSRFYEDGRGFHEVRLPVENTGLSQIVVVAPDTAEVSEVLVNDRRLSAIREQEPGQIVIPLPPRDRYAAVTIRYVTRGPSLGVIQELTAPWPGVPLPILDRHWELILPPGYRCEPLGADAREQNRWSRRLFGPLLATHTSPSNPWEASYWIERLYRAASPGDIGLEGDQLAPQDQAETSRAQGDKWTFPADSPGDSLGDSPGLSGWTRTTLTLDRTAIEFPASTMTRTRVCQVDVLGAISWAAFLAALGLTGWIGARWQLMVVPLVTISGLWALFGPLLLAPVWTTVFLGAVVSAGILLLRPIAWRWQSPARRDASSLRSTAVARAITGILALAILAISAAMGFAQPSGGDQPDDPPDDPPQKIYRVLYPVDEKREPVGDYVFLPEAFHDALVREASINSIASQMWLIHSAEYRLMFERQVEDDRIDAQELVANFQLETFRPAAKITLPIDSNRVYLLPNRARLDGQPASSYWEPDGRSLSIDVPNAGKATLELAFRPQTVQADDLVLLDMIIPRVPQARTRLQLPADAGDAVCTTALGRSFRDEHTGEQFIELGPVGRLSLQWPAHPEWATNPSSLEVTQLMWMDVEPGATHLKARFQIAAVTGSVRQLDLVVDPRLRLLPPGKEQPIARYFRQDPDGSKMRFLMRPPFESQAEFELEFVLADSGGLDEVRLPELQAVSGQTQRCLLAVSVDPMLDYDLPDSHSPNEATQAIFEQAWGTLANSPSFVVSVPDVGLDWSFTTRPRAMVQLLADQQTRVAFGRRQADLMWEADVLVEAGQCFQHEIAIPARAEIQAVSVVEDGQERLASWWQDARNRLVLRMEQPVAGPHRIQVRLSVPVQRSRPVTMNPPQLSQATVQSDSIALFRQSSAWVEIVETPGFVAVADAELGTYQPAWGRLLSVLARQDDAAAQRRIVVNVSPNRPPTHGMLVIRLDREQDTWIVSADCRLTIQRGRLDMVRLAVPAEWNGPFQVQGDVDTELVTIPGQSRGYLIIRPKTAATKELRFQVSGSLLVSQDARVHAPDIRLLEAANVERYVLVPRVVGGQQIDWEVMGLQPADLPDVHPPIDESNHTCYAALWARFKATLRDVVDSPGNPEIPLAEVALACGPNGGEVGEAYFDIVPGGGESCQLRLPEGCRLVHLEIGGLPAIPEQQEGNLWQLALPATQQIQPIRVIYVRTAPSRDEDGSTHSLAMPEILGLNAERIEWSVCHSADQQLLGPAMRASQVENPRAESNLEAGHENAIGPMSPIGSMGPISPKPRAGSNLEPCGKATTVSGVQYDAQSPVDLHLSPCPAPYRGQRAVMASLLIALAVLSFVRSPALAGEGRSRSRLTLIGLAIGIAWWVWCTPSFVGLLAVAFSLVILVWPRRGTKRPEAATIPIFIRE